MTRMAPIPYRGEQLKRVELGTFLKCLALLVQTPVNLPLLLNAVLQVVSLLLKVTSLALPVRRGLARLPLSLSHLLVHLEPSPRAVRLECPLPLLSRGLVAGFRPETRNSKPETPDITSIQVVSLFR